jgi:hypothetical protein
MSNESAEPQEAGRHIGLVRAASVVLEQLLQLPPGHVIVSAVWDMQTQQIMLAIEGPSMPFVKHGYHALEIRPVIRTVRPGRPIDDDEGSLDFAIGKALSDILTESSVDADWFDSREIDRLVTAVRDVLPVHQVVTWPGVEP